MAAQTLYAAMATASWIDPKSKLKKVDPVMPANTVSKAFLASNADHFRFSNLLETYITVNDAGAITGGGFTAQSGMYRGPSAFGLDSMPYPVKQTMERGGAYTFTQIVGARTHTPETVGEGVGALGGAAAGGGLSLLFPPAAIVLVPGGAAVGYLAGKYGAKRIFDYPPIWSELVLTFSANGTFQTRVARHSLFPSLTTYRQDGPAAAKPATSFSRIPTFLGQPYYDGVPALSLWQDHGWGPLRGGSIGPTPGNPWGANLSSFEHI